MFLKNSLYVHTTLFYTCAYIIALNFLNSIILDKLLIFFFNYLTENYFKVEISNKTSIGIYIRVFWLRIPAFIVEIKKIICCRKFSPNFFNKIDFIFELFDKKNLN